MMIVIPSRFNGPPSSANGGYAAGLFASTVVGDAAAEVTLRRPPPLDHPLAVRDSETHDGEVHDGAEGLVAQVRAVSGVDVVVPAVTWAEASEAAHSFLGALNHPFPTCFVCGTERSDGLRLFPGRLSDGRSAAPFAVPDDINRAMVWAALDCPGGWAMEDPTSGPVYLLGRLTVQVGSVPSPGDRCVVMGAVEGVEGRKAMTLTTLYGPSGDVLAQGRATWLAV